MAVLQSETPNADRLHIGFFGKRNSGKSSLLNALTGQSVSIVSEVPGTTTDPVYKAIEIHGLGPCVFMDTAGFDDAGDLGEIRVEKTKLAAEKTDIAVVVFTPDDFQEELAWVKTFREKNVPVVAVLSKADANSATDLPAKLKEAGGPPLLRTSAKDGSGISTLKEALIRAVPEDFGRRSITGDLVREGDVVLLVMPQDLQAPKGRLILPQVQTLRDLLDKKCLVLSVTTDKLDQAFSALSVPPKLIITDSQVFGDVYAKKPKESLLTSFSVLFAAHKGDIQTYLQGAKAIDALTEQSQVLIAECCTHAPLSEDIGRVKLPRILRQRVGEGLRVQVVSGTDYPTDLTSYDLIIQCGACMFNRTYVLSRIDRAADQGVPITNYGIALAHLTGILDHVVTT